VEEGPALCYPVRARDEQGIYKKKDKFVTGGTIVGVKKVGFLMGKRKEKI